MSAHHADTDVFKFLEYILTFACFVYVVFANFDRVSDAFIG